MKNFKPLLTRRATHRVMPLEARLMFDAAAAVDATKPVEAASGDATPLAAVTNVASAEAPAAEPGRTLSVINLSLLSPAQQQGLAGALEQVNATLARLPNGSNFADLLTQVFGQTGTDAASFAQHLAELRDAFNAGSLNIQIELRSGAELHGAFAAYAAKGPDGQERIYLNADWLVRGASEADVAARLLEEVGHAFDQRLNAGVDTAGDEGERFSALVRGGTLSDVQSQAMFADADQDTLTLDGQEVEVEFAELSVPFPEGFIGTKGTNSNQASGVLNFATLGIVRASFYQDSGSGQFTLQGNDIPGGLRITLSSGRVITVTGAINWRVTSGSTLYCFGFVPDAATTPTSFTYGGGTTFTISNTSNFGLELVGVSYSTADNSNINGNAATTGLLTALNGYLAQVQANDPNGPVTVDSLATTDTTPTLTGTATLNGANGETLSVSVNGVTYTTGNGLSVVGNNWSLTIPNGSELASGTYSVTATITNNLGYTLTDTTASELIVDGTAPVVTASQSFNYAENQTAGTTIATVAATDNVGVTGFRFSSTGTTTSADGYYSINSSGQISLTTAGAAASANDYETLPNAYTLGVQARDAVGNWSNAVNVTLNVTDLDDVAPVVGAGQSYGYAENQTSGTTLATVTATDDAAVTGYRFSSTGTATSADGYFSINSSGQISLTTAGAAAGVSANDYETLPNGFTLGVQARDAAGNWSNAVNVTLSVTDVDDTAPVVAGGQSISYSENQASGTVLGTVSASDAVGVTGFRFSATGTATSSDGYFSIDSSGQISLTAAGAAAGASSNDYETTPNSFSLGLQARDAAGNWSSAVNVTLNVTDVDDTVPVVASSQSFNYAENQASGAVVGTVSASDAVGVTGFRFSSTGTATSSDGFFSIDNSGQISLTTAGAAAGASSNDYETLPNGFTLGVQARDAAGNWSSAVNVTLNVTDVDDALPVVAASQSFSYAENQASGTVLGTVAATDNVAVTGYRFSSSGTTTSADGYFTLNSSGQLSLTPAGAAVGIAANDYETTPNSFTLGVQACDAAGNWSSAVNVTLNVTDLDESAPVVAASQSFHYAENQASGTTLATVAATDNVAVTGYRFSDTGTTTSADGHFSINGGGQISLTTAGAAAGVAANDFETAPNGFTLGVQARDAAGNWSSAANVTLNVTDLDDTAPAVAAGQSFSYAENQAAGSVLGTVSASDAVGVTGFRFSDSGTATSSDGYFSIDSSGQISLTTAGAAAGIAANDYETTPNGFSMGVQARDAAGNWSSAVNVVLNVTDLDDTAPVIAASQSFSYAENQTSGTVLATVGASDAVGVTDYRFSSTGTAVSSDGYFAIDSSGHISLTAAGAAAGVAANDFETTPNTFSLGVQARDAVGNWSAAVNVALAVTDVDDTAPVIAPHQTIHYPEGRDAGAVLGTVSATDAVGITGFRFASTGTHLSSDGFFSIDGAGQISLTAAGAAAAANDFESTPNSFAHSLQAADAAGNWSTSVGITLSVTDVDEAAALPDTGQALEDSPVVGNVLTNDLGLAPSVVSFEVGGHSALAGGTLTLSGIGSITMAASGAYTFIPEANWSGSVPSITYVTDSGRTAVLSLVVTPVNDAPALTPDALTTFQDVPWEGQLPAGTDVEGDSLTYSLVQSPTHGAVTVAANGSYQYVPDTGYSGADRFQVEVSDGQGGTAQVWVEVTVAPSPSIGLPAPWDLGASNTDRTTSANVITLAGSGTPGQTLRLYSPSGQLIGTTVVDGQGQWSVSNIDMRSLTGDAPGQPAGAIGAYTFTVRAALPGGVLSAAVPLTIQRENEAPVPTVAPQAPTPVVVAPVAAPLVQAEPVVVASTPPAFDSALRPVEARPELILTVSRPQESASGNVSQITARDSNIADIYTRPSGFQIMVNPSPEPSLKLFRGLDDQVVKLGTTVQLQVPADTFVHTNINETVVLKATLADGRALPKWLQFDGRTGALTGEVPSEWREDLVVRVVARDSQGREATATMRVKVSAGSSRPAGLSGQLMRGHAAPVATMSRAATSA
jgi:hypothetical protein